MALINWCHDFLYFTVKMPIPVCYILVCTGRVRDQRFKYSHSIHSCFISSLQKNTKDSGDEQKKDPSMRRARTTLLFPFRLRLRRLVTSLAYM